MTTNTRVVLIAVDVCMGEKPNVLHCGKREQLQLLSCKSQSSSESLRRIQATVIMWLRPSIAAQHTHAHTHTYDY